MPSASLPGKRHPLEMGQDEITRFLSALAIREYVSASTQNQALCALALLYRHVLGQNLGWLEDVVLAKRLQHLPTMMYTHALNGAGNESTAPSTVSELGGLYGGVRMLDCTILWPDRRHTAFDRKT